ncbi:flavonoid 3'-monooxygenase CYP75B137 [Elaeis guineensis]|uniref:Flavonoid 3'-monooxygenase CYP75B3 n=1 Tax=Elaeis guineensis var. tenera TaxID=51953 RepID=A0A6I9S885_ELAGV|nr:flavonoid 3'-monooxygenase CYP75B3 [Elaeis guineensis]
MAPLLLLLSTLLLSSLLYYFFFSKGRTQGSRAPLPPGPTGWPVLGNLPQLGSKPHHTLHALSRAHGPIFRLRLGSVDVVVAASAAVATQFLRAHDANFSHRPPNSGAEHIAYNYQDLVFAPYGPRWRARRKLLNLHLFSGKALEDLRPVREGELAVLVRALWDRTGANEPVDLGRAANKCATNALARATVGRRVFQEEEEEEAAEFKNMVVELMRLAGVFNVGDFVPGIGWLDLQGVVRRMKKLHRRLDRFLDGLIAEHRRAANGGGGGGAKDLLSVLLGLKEEDLDIDGEGGKLTDTDIKALLLNLFTAGTDTTSSTVEWALAELIKHPDILRKAQVELDSVVGRDRLVSESDLPNLPFVQAISKETFRLHPSTPLSLPRMSSEACEVAGYHIPQGATLLVNVWAIARDPAVWHDPLEFQPARFLPGGGYEHMDVKGNDFEIIPFGAGRRICAGMSLGIRMVQFMIASLVHAFDWALPEGQMAEKLDMEEAYGLTLQRAMPLMVHPVPRLASAAY